MAQDSLRQHVLDLLDGQQAHQNFDYIVSGMMPTIRGKRPPQVPYSPWELLEHMRVAQHDILEFCRNPNYEQPSWPDDYWPSTPAPPSRAAWSESAEAFRADLSEIKAMVRGVDDLYAEIPHGSGQTYLREALLVADHNAYHLGQLVTVRRLLGAWPPQ